METLDYTFGWIVYLMVAVIIAVMIWRVLKKYLWRGLAYLLQGFLVAVLFTPWYVLPDEEILAPAFIIFLMDTITVDVATGIRALIPIIMAMLLAIIMAVILSIIHRMSHRKKRVE